MFPDLGKRTQNGWRNIQIVGEYYFSILGILGLEERTNDSKSGLPLHFGLLSKCGWDVVLITTSIVFD